jgi:hypothetical protein
MGNIAELSEKERAKLILNTLVSLGIHRYSIQTNYYWYKIPLGKLTIHFNDQGERLIGEIYRTPHNSREEEIIKKSSMFLADKNRCDDFKKTFSWIDFIYPTDIEGIEEAIKNIIDLAKSRLIQKN